MPIKQILARSAAIVYIGFRRHVKVRTRLVHINPTHLPPQAVNKIQHQCVSSKLISYIRTKQMILFYLQTSAPKSDNRFYNPTIPSFPRNIATSRALGAWPENILLRRNHWHRWQGLHSSGLPTPRCNRTLSPQPSVRSHDFSARGLTSGTTCRNSLFCTR
jgi:hypothetical protein